MTEAEAGIGCPLSATYSVIPALRHQPELRRRVGAAHPLLRVRPSRRAGHAEVRRPRRHGHDREAGRLRCACQHHRGPAAERRRPRRRVRDHRAQVVLLDPDERRLPGPGSGRRRHLLLPLSALDAGRRAQQLPPPAAEGQARQPRKRLQRGRVRRRLGTAGRRGGRWSADDHRDGQPHEIGLRARQRRGDACRPRRGHPPRGASLDLRQDCWSSSR